MTFCPVISNFFLPYGSPADPAKLVEKLGERYEVTRTNIKKWTVGSPIQAPLDALENLQKKNHFEADQVQHVNVRVATEEAALVNNREIPDIRLQHMVAVMLIDKTASFASAHDKPPHAGPRGPPPARESSADPRRGTRTPPAATGGHRGSYPQRWVASQRNRHSRAWHSGKSDDAR